MCYRQNNKRGEIEKWDQTGDPEIPDMGGDIRNSGLLSGGSLRSVWSRLSMARCGGVGGGRNGGVTRGLCGAD